MNSYQATQFRIWATQRLREYIVKWFAMDDERLKQRGGGNYFEELLARIRDIRSSEKGFGARCSRFTRRALITPRAWRHRSNSSPRCRTRCTVRRTARRRRRSFMRGWTTRCAGGGGERAVFDGTLPAPPCDVRFGFRDFLHNVLPGAGGAIRRGNRKRWTTQMALARGEDFGVSRGAGKCSSWHTLVPYRITYRPAD